MSVNQSKPVAANWRLTQLARFAAERANLLRQFRGIGETALSEEAVSGKWTAKDMLPHIAYWDAFHAGLIAKTADGRPQSIQPIAGMEQLAELNEQTRLRHQAIPLEQALAICLKERGGFLAMLARLSDQELHTLVEMGDGRKTYPYKWVEWRIVHDADHAAELAQWRETLPAETTRQIAPKFIVRETLNATRKEFLAIAALVPAAERNSKPVCGVWTLKDLIGHLLDWELIGIGALRQLAAEQAPEFEPILDFEAFNTNCAAARRDQPWDQIWEAFGATRRELLDLLDQLSDEQLKRPFQAPWNSTTNGYAWISIWSDHEHEHAADVRTAVS